MGKWEKFLAKMMESITKAGRSVSNGVYRVAGAFARGARRVLSYVPLLGVAVAPPELEEVEEAEASSLVRYSPNYFILSRGLS